MAASAAFFDVADYIWRRYIGDKKKSYKEKDRRHTAVIEKNDIYGIRQTRSVKPSFQIRLLKEPNILYRNFTESEIEYLDKYSKDYRGKIILNDLPEGRQRHAKKVVPESKVLPNRVKDKYFKPSTAPNERLVIDKENYQWRKVKPGTKPINIIAKKSGKFSGKLAENDVFGLRYVKPSFGGYILFSDGTRRNINSSLYEELVEKTMVLPTRYQKTGLLEVKEVKRAIRKEEKEVKKPVKKIEIHVPKQIVEKPIVRKYDIDSDVEDILDKISKKTHRAIRSVRTQLKKESPELFDALENEDDEDQINVNNQQDDDLEDWPEDVEDFEEDDETEEDVEENTEQDEEDSLPLADVLAPGDIIKFRQAPDKEFVFLQQSTMERNPNLVEFFFHDRKSGDESIVYRVRQGLNYTMAKFKEDGASVQGTVPDNELEKLLGALDYAETKNISLFKL